MAKLQVRIDTELASRVIKSAKANFLSATQEVNRLIREALKKGGK